MYISNICLKKIFSDKTVPNFESQEVGPKWHFLSTILQIFTGKMFFKFSLNLAGKILKSRVFLKSSLLVVYRRPLEWLWDILLGREICSQSWAIIFQKSTKFQIFESQGNVLLIFYMKQLESDKTKVMAELALRSRFP